MLYIKKKYKKSIKINRMVILMEPTIIVEAT